MVGSVVYRLMQRKEGWIISLFGKVFGPCASGEDALDVALSAAQKAIEKGCSAEIQVYVNGEFHPVWTDGEFRDDPQSSEAVLSG